MRRPFVRLIIIYLVFLVVFFVAKLLFMLLYFNTYGEYDFFQWLGVYWHGLPLDASVAGYLSVFPGLLLCCEGWIPPRAANCLWRGYFALVGILLASIMTADAMLYGYWGFRLDSTPLFYLKNPSLALASASWWQLLAGAACIAVLSIGLYEIFVHVAVTASRPDKRYRIASSVLLFIMTAMLIIPIRGGFSVSVMNIGKVYYSTDMALNHAAVNPCFSFMESLSHDNDFSEKYRFMSQERAASLFAQMTDDGKTPSIMSLLNTRRPNIILVVLESFMTECLDNGAAPHLDSIARQGVNFTNFYANSFRTDRGLVSILSGYPSQPTLSIMKYPRKTESLPSIPKTLSKYGYSLRYYYGGDADFTNMRSYLRSCRVNEIVSEDDFPDTPKFKWGVHDEYLFRRLERDLSQEDFSQPFFYIVQTSSSHEPFEVPAERVFDDPYLNSVAYTDACIGEFADWLRKSRLWDNTIVVFVADHAMRWPQSRTNYDVERYRIPFIITGGALNRSVEIDIIGSQIDIAATLLAQMQIDYSEFVFSKNILNFSAPHFAYFSAPDLFGFIVRRAGIVWDCALQEPARSYGDTTGLVDYGKALLQTLYEDIDSR